MTVAGFRKAKTIGFMDRYPDQRAGRGVTLGVVLGATPGRSPGPVTKWQRTAWPSI
jgi:hypothetical protein